MIRNARWNRSFSRYEFFIIILLCFSCNSSSRQEGKIPKVVFIIVDGIADDVIKKLNPPTLHEISQAGGFTRAYVGGGKNSYNQSPTISAVGYNSLLTGTWANKHNVWDNDILNPNYNYWSVFRIAKEINPDLKTGIFSTWLDNRTKLVGDGLEQTGKLAIDYSFDGLELDTINFPHDKERTYIQRIDEAVSDEAARVITSNAPDLSWIYLEFTDDMGHLFGDSPQYYDAILAADKQIGKVWSAIKEREKKFNEDWLIVITTDHGRDAETGRNHGGQSDRERSTWIVTNAKQLNKHFYQLPGVVDILPSIARHLNLALPEEIARELDGVPFMGGIQLADLRGTKTSNKIQLHWKSFSLTDNEKAEIYVSETNHFKTGTNDIYYKAGEVSARLEHFEFTPKTDSEFFKIVVAVGNQRINVWIPSGN
jgi:predicted AlkP superfamily pyrophosphatase or phosphodiesterase